MNDKIQVHANKIWTSGYRDATNSNQRYVSKIRPLNIENKLKQSQQIPTLKVTDFNQK